MQPSRFVEPEQPAEVGQILVQVPAEARLESGLDRAGEAGPSQRRPQFVVEVRRRFAPRAGDGDEKAENARQDCEGKL
jgi:hypothetical protein